MLRDDDPLTVTLNLPPDTEHALINEAQAKGMSLDEWVGTASECRSVPRRRSRLWELREGLALGDVSIKELIAEGRE